MTREPPKFYHFSVTYSDGVSVPSGFGFGNDYRAARRACVETFDESELVSHVSLYYGNRTVATYSGVWTDGWVEPVGRL